MINLDKSIPLLMSLKPLFKELSQYSMQNGKRPANATVIQREYIIVQEMYELLAANYNLKKIGNMTNKHFNVLLKCWYLREYTLDTLYKRISLFALVFKLINKQGMQVDSLRDNPIPEHFFTESSNEQATEMINTDDCLLKIKQIRLISEEIAVHLELILGFNLSKKEAFCLNPLVSIKGRNLIIAAGVTKGNERNIVIKSNYQKQVITRALKMVKSKSTVIRPSGMTERQYLNHYDYICRQANLKVGDLKLAYKQNEEA